MNEHEIISAMKSALAVSHERDADFGEHILAQPALIVSSVDRAKHGTAPPCEPLDIWAFRAVNAAVSDLACAGVTAGFIQIDAQIPAHLNYEDVMAVGRGIASAIDTLGVRLINGNNTTIGPLSLTTVAQGWRSIEPRPPGRAGAAVGDWLVCSRLPGRFTSALDALAAGDEPGWLSGALLGGVAELEVGRCLVDNGIASALIDANDCLLLTVRDLARASGVGIWLDRESLETAAATVAWMPSMETMLAPPSGDLALIASVPDQRIDELRSIFRDLGRTPVLAGRIVDGAGEVSVDGWDDRGLDEVAARRWHAAAPVRYPVDDVRALLRAGVRAG